MPGGSGCFVPLCDTGRKGCTEKRTVFSVPRDPDMLQKWKELIPKSHRELGPNDKICHVHFAEDDIRKGLKVVVGGKEDIFPMLWRLKPTAIPRFFSCKSRELNTTTDGCHERQRRKSSKVLTLSDQSTRSSVIIEDLTNPVLMSAPTIHSTGKDENTENPEAKTKIILPCVGSRLIPDNESELLPSKLKFFSNFNQNVVEKSNEEIMALNAIPASSQYNQSTLLDPLKVTLPPSWNWHIIPATTSKFGKTQLRERKLCILPSVSLGEVFVVKAIEIAPNHSVIYYIYGKRFESVDLEYHFQSLVELEDIFNHFDKAGTCKGCMETTFLEIKFCASGYFHGGVWRSNKCQLLVQNSSTCSECTKLRSVLEPRAKRKSTLAPRKRRVNSNV